MRGPMLYYYHLEILHFEQGALKIMQLVLLRGFVTQNLPCLPPWAGNGTGVCVVTPLSIVVNSFATSVDGTGFLALTLSSSSHSSRSPCGSDRPSFLLHGRVIGCRAHSNPLPAHLQIPYFQIRAHSQVGGVGGQDLTVDFWGDTIQPTTLA